MVIDWGQTPIANALVRGIVAALLSGVLAGVIRLQMGAILNEAILTGVAVAIPPLVSLTGFGLADQSRADRGKVIASDVPVQIQSRVTNVSTALVARDLSSKGVA
jgi:hypothetical protein